ncbi:hypothetical protein RQP46_001176 [Phenoliferia psychrophenolica]
MERSRKAEQVGPDPWPVRKFAVFLVGAIFIYTYYVFVGRVAVKMYVPQTDPPKEEADLVDVVGYRFEDQLARQRHTSSTAEDLRRRSESPNPAPHADNDAGRDSFMTRETLEDTRENFSIGDAAAPLVEESAEDELAETHPSTGARSSSTFRSSSFVLLVRPGVGTCVGARNYKYFYNFLQWSTFFTIFVFISLTIDLTLPLHSPTRPHPSLDGQIIAIISISGFFSFFTGALFVAHTRLLLLNMTTIEEMGMARIKARERIPIPASPTPDDGLSYVPNPRFSKEGVWRPRRQWPRELQ